MRHTMAQDAERARDARAARLARRRQLMRGRLDAAQTPEARLSAAFDWFRASARRLATEGMSRDGNQPSRPAAERIMREVSDYLAQAADRIDGGARDDAQ